MVDAEGDLPEDSADDLVTGRVVRVDVDGNPTEVAILAHVVGRDSLLTVGLLSRGRIAVLLGRKIGTSLMLRRGVTSASKRATSRRIAQN